MNGPEHPNSPVIPQIKFCGLRRLDDISLVNRFKPDYAGLIFAPGKRQVSVHLARQMVDALSSDIRPVGVFVDEQPETIARIVRTVDLRVVQLHGQEGIQQWEQLRELLGPDILIWQKLAIPIDPAAAARRVEDIEAAMAIQKGGQQSGLPYTVPDLYLLDTESDGISGGTGQTFPWSLLADFARHHRIAVAGGLNPDTVAAAIAALHPAVVDCSSGIERQLIKQADLMERFCRIVRQQERT